MEKKQKSRVLDMTTGKPFYMVLRFALPLFFGNLLQQFYNLADTAIAGNILGDQALAEIGAVTALYSLIINFAFGLNNGFALSVSRSFGAGDKKGVQRAANWMILLSVGFSVVLTLVSLLGERGLLRALHVAADIRAGASAYLTVILIGIPLTMIYNMESAMMQAVGNSLTPLLFLLLSSVLNIGLDVLFMGPCAMGVRGAAIATVLAQGISAVLGFFYMRKHYADLRLEKDSIKQVDKAYVMDMTWTGLSMALMNAIYNVGSVILQGSINALGNVYIAAQVGARRVAEFFYTPGLALGTSVATYASQNMGAGKRKRIGKGIWTAIILYGIWWGIAMLFLVFFAEDTLRLITGSETQEVIASALRYLRISIPMVPPMAVLVIMRNALQGMKHLVMPLVCSGLELLGKVIFAIWLVPVYGYIAVCICEPVTWVVCFLFIMTGAWVYRQEFREEPVQETCA